MNTRDVPDDVLRKPDPHFLLPFFHWAARRLRI